MASWQRTWGEESPKFWPVEICLSKHAQFGTENPFWRNLWAKLNVSAPIISPVENLQLSVKNFQLPVPSTFCTLLTSVRLYPLIILTTVGVARSKIWGGHRTLDTHGERRLQAYG